MPEEKRMLTVNCPTCKQPVTWTPKNKYRPFCSERCRLIDLGAWANEEHTIAGEPDLDQASSDQMDLAKLLQGRGDS